MSFSEILIETTAGTDPLFTVKEAAKIMGVSEPTVYDYRQDRTEPGYSKIKEYAIALCDKGYHKLSFQFWPNGNGEANGETSDETIRIVRHLGHIEDSPNCKNTVLNAAGGIEQEARNLRAEGEAL